MAVPDSCHMPLDGTVELNTGLFEVGDFGCSQCAKDDRDDAVHCNGESGGFINDNPKALCVEVEMALLIAGRLNRAFLVDPNCAEAAYESNVGYSIHQPVTGTAQ